jgi:hypothetical protein
MNHKILFCSKSFQDKLINYNYPNKNILIALKEIAGLIYCEAPLDRANFYPHPLLIQAPKIPKIKNVSLDECMYERAIEISNMIGRKKILWSGGLDSTATLIALMKYDDISNYQIVCRKSSIEEYPEFYKKYVSKMNYTIETNSVNNFYNKVFDDSIVVTGCLGDHLFFDYLMIKNMEISLDKSWKSLIDILVNEKELCVDILEKHVLNSPISINTVGDMYWWIKFALDWSGDIYKFGLSLDNPKNVSNHMPFFGTDKFQSWALHNYNDIRITQLNEMYKHKHQLKKYIYKFTKDQNYFNNKNKENSYKLGFNSEQMKFKRHCLYDDYTSPSSLVDFFNEHCY